MVFKKIIVAIASVFVCAFYLLSAIGIDIHIDHHNGKCYVVPLVMGTDCHDIHKNDVCACCHDHSAHEGADCPDGDCDNIVEILEVNGTGFQGLSHEDIVPFCPVCQLLFSYCDPVGSTACQLASQYSGAPPDYPLERICLLRI